MNSKTLKKLRKRAKQLQVVWLKSMVNSEEAKGINLQTLKSLLPKQTHYYAMVAGSRGYEHSCIRLSYMTEKWIMKILKKKPHIKTIGELNEINEQHQQLQRNNSSWMSTF